MSGMIAVSASAGRITAYGQGVLTRALAEGGEVGGRAEARLGPKLAAVEGAFTQRKLALAAEATARAAVVAADTRSCNGILMVSDTAWNLLGRPSESEEMDHMFPNGAKLYTEGQPRLRPRLMQILVSRIESLTTTRLTGEQRAVWVKDLQALRAPQEAALAAHEPLEVGATVANASFRSAVRALHVQLRMLKKDLQGMGVSAARVNAIMPDAASSGGRPTKKPEGGGAPTGGGTGAGNDHPPAGPDEHAHG